MMTNKNAAYTLVGVVGVAIALFAGLPFYYLLFLACPVMMFFMMSSMSGGMGGSSSSSPTPDDETADKHSRTP